MVITDGDKPVQGRVELDFERFIEAGLVLSAVNLRKLVQPRVVLVPVDAEATGARSDRSSLRAESRQPRDPCVRPGKASTTQQLESSPGQSWAAPVSAVAVLCSTDPGTVDLPVFPA